MLIGIVDSGGANLASIQFAIQRAGFNSFLSADQAALEKADKLILPGVGAASLAMNNLQEKKLIDFLRNTNQPIMGICLGMQLLFEHSEEGNVNCLGLIPGKVKSIPKDDNFSIPHMGWNQLNQLNDCSLLRGIPENSYVYFVHSYYAEVSQYTLASCKYNVEVSAIVGQTGIWGCQFHPEKSGEIGTQIIKNYCSSKEGRN